MIQSPSTSYSRIAAAINGMKKQSFSRGDILRLLPDISPYSVSEFLKSRCSASQLKTNGGKRGRRLRYKKIKGVRVTAPTPRGSVADAVWKVIREAQNNDLIFSSIVEKVKLLVPTATYQGVKNVVGVWKRDGYLYMVVDSYHIEGEARDIRPPVKCGNQHKQENKRPERRLMVAA